jgi:hypothetical protein
LAPLLVHGRKRLVYISLVAVLLAGFALYQYNDRPDDMGHRPPMERNGHHQPPRLGELPEEGEGARPPHGDMRPPRDFQPHDFRPHDNPPPIIGERDILAIVVLLLMFGANLGIKYYYRSHADRKRLYVLERQNLEQQLEYLRYQINPHFFMNTLNNIHALVDIDPEKAKDTILELSRMMRFVLYEANKKGVPLSRELDFIRHYVALMQLRYTDKVRIDIDLPTEVPDCQIPPLMLITFIENAFKHGVSYQHESFIEVRVRVEDGELRFSCRNSLADAPAGEKGGVGLANVRKRLHLLYGGNYTLRIHQGTDAYPVELNIPL